MTKLLISVRNAAEAELALAGGADVIDVKEPRRGALGPADPLVWHEVHAAVRGRAVTSAALGELLFDRVEELAVHAAGFRFAKIGLAGCQAANGWIARWRRAIRALPAGVEPVPVAYADWSAANAPSPSVALILAQHSAARLLLIDTHEKGRGGLLDHLPIESLREIAHDAKQASIRLALAGSLDESAIRALLDLAPSYIGVRGAACRGGRDGAIELARVKSLAGLLRAQRQKAAS